MAGYFDFGIPRGGLWGMPDMPNIQQSLADNAALGATKKPGFFDEGGVGRNMAGYIGDALAQLGGMQPIYAPVMQEQRQLQADQARYEQRRAAEQAQWDLRRQIEDAAYRPNEVRDADYYRRSGNPQAAEDILAKATMVPVQRADPVTGEVRYEYVRPSQMTSGASADLPAPKSAAEAAALPPGTQFRAPDGSIRRVPGGASPSNGSGGFRF